MNDVDNTGREPCVVQHLKQRRRGERGFLGHAADDRAPGGEHRRDFARLDGNGKIPRRQAHGHAERVLGREMAAAR